MRRVSGVPVLWRNLGVVALAAAAVTAAGSYGANAVSLLFTIANIAFLVVLAWFAYTVWRGNRGTFGLMPRARRYLLYGAAVGVALCLVTAPFWVRDFLTAVVFFAVLGGLGYVIWWLWQESRRYYY